MSRYFFRLSLFLALFVGGSGVAFAYLSPSNPAVLDPVGDPQAAFDFQQQIQYMNPSYQDDYQADNSTYVIGPGRVPDYLTNPNWAFSPLIRKFIDTLPGLGASNANNLGQYIPVAVPDITTYPGSDYYVIELREFREQMHSDMPASPAKADYAGVVTSGTTLRGYIQTNLGTDTSGGCTDPSLNLASKCIPSDNTVVVQTKPHYLGPIIVAQKDRPVRVKFVNKLPTGAGGDLFVPVDTSIMGAGPFDVNYDPVTKDPLATNKTGNFLQNRGLLHLHGGRTPWISDGTPHQWITPAGELPTDYPTGVSMKNVPDMPDPGPGANTYYWTNQQSARMMFYHDHAWGITRLNVYVGEAAGYLIRDETERKLIDGGIIPGTDSNGTIVMGGEIPLVFQMKTYVDAATIMDTDPTWNWGSGTPDANGIRPPVTGDLWWPHVYMPAQNPFDISGVAPMGRWVYGPYFWPATPNFFQPIPNPYYNAACYNDSAPTNATTSGYLDGFCQPPEIPSTPEPSWGAEAFVDTPIVNGAAYPVLNVEPKAYRFRILNADHDSFINLQMYIADNATTRNNPNPTFVPDLTSADYNADGWDHSFANKLAKNTEIRMLPASDSNGSLSTAPPGGTVLSKPETWPNDGREGGIPDWSWKGPDWIMIGAEGGFLPQPVVIPAQPLTWIFDATLFNVGNVNGGSLILGPAERADVIVDFSQYAGQTLIVYNDATRPWPALDPHYDFYTDDPDRRDMGGADSTLAGFGPNVRTYMQIHVAATTPDEDFTLNKLTALQNEFDPNTAVKTAPDGVFKSGQDTIIAGQGNMNPNGDPSLYETYLGPTTDFSAYDTAYGNNATNSFSKTWPTWGIANINDKDISFYSPATGQDETITMKTKSIHDEMGGTFDEFGRLRAALGLVPTDLPVGQATFVGQTYSDPSTEILAEDGIQVWKITHNGVDSHPIHFHLYDVQVLNRVGWDGFKRLPDPTELGWKDTVRISPLEDTIVAIKPITPRLPFGIPESYRPLNPATPLNDATHLSLTDPNTGNPWPTNAPNLNRMENFDWEYVWHCHILSHEENDMMRPVIFQFTEGLPDAPTGLTATAGVNGIDLGWTDPTPTSDNTTLANPKNEVLFLVERADDNGGSPGTWAPLGTSLANTTSYTDTSAVPGTTYHYLVYGANAAGQNGTLLQPGAVSDNATAIANDIFLTSPLNGSTYLTTDTIPLAASAVGSITAVEFFSGGGTTPLGITAPEVTSPFTSDWSGMSAGAYSLIARGSGGGSIDSLVVNVTVLPAPPTVAITSPANAATYFFGDIITIVADAIADPSLTINKVEFYVDGVLSGTDISFPYGITYTNAPIGTHVLTATAYDNHGVSSTSAIVSLTVVTGADMSSPTNNAILGGTSQQFTWNSVGGAINYQLWVSSFAGGRDLGVYNTGTATSVVATGIPANGQAIYVRLYTYVAGIWIANNYTYTAPGPAIGAVMLSPTNNVILGGTSQQFTWNSVWGVINHQLWVGSSAGGRDFGVYNTGTGTSVVATGIPSNGQSIYVRLYTNVAGTWFANNYTYTASGTPIGADMSSPANNAVLDVASQQFTWNSVSGAINYQLWVGSSAGKRDLGAYNVGTATSFTVTGLPTGGQTIYIRLYTNNGGAWFFNNYTYIAANVP